MEIRRINIRQGNNRLCIICIDVQYAPPAISWLFQKLIAIHVLIYTIVDICSVRIDFLTQYRIDVQYHEKFISMQKKTTIACISGIYQNDINITSMLEIYDNMFPSVACNQIILPHIKIKEKMYKPSVKMYHLTHYL